MRPHLLETLEALVPDPLTAVREGCAFVASRARSVRVDEAAIRPYATALDPASVEAAQPLELPGLRPDVEERAQFILMIDAVNFGSGYWPHLRKRPGLSGYRTIEAALLEHFRNAGPPRADALAEIDARACAGLFGQSLEPPIDELMEHFAAAWRELGERVAKDHAGSFRSLVRAAGGSAPRMVELLLGLVRFRDIADYEGRRIPLLKRAQIVVADLAATLPAPEGEFSGMSSLTLFADNLVPHVLRLDGVLHFEASMLQRIEREELLTAGSAEEVEMRACAVHAVELLAKALAEQGKPLCAHELDRWLWQRGGSPRYKSQPRPRARSIYY